MLPRVFEMFAQVNRSLKRAEGGLGIGLALARGLAELHGGTIEAHSAGEGLGSEFIVRLPLAVEPAAQWRVDGPGEPLTLDRRRILVVDDNRDAADTLAMLLKLLGADVQTVYDGASALEAMRAVRPAAVLLDLGMPAMDGYEVARRIRAEPELRDVFLIALTGWGQEDDRRRSQDAGFNVHLVKPVDHLALRTLLADLPPAPASGQQHASLRR
ncbi:MAG TPA: response regulator [Pirellulales bacterium]|nr:response regulator [Pirellulales bacterium]